MLPHSMEETLSLIELTARVNFLKARKERPLKTNITITELALPKW